MAVKHNFDSKVVLVTGSSSGVGEELNESRIESVAAKCEQLSPNKPLAVVADLTNEKDVEKLVEKTINHFGGIDILVNNAGVATGDTILSPNILSTFDKMIATNLRPVIQLCNLCLPHLQKSKGCIVMHSSTFSNAPSPLFASYSISKAGLNMLAKIIAIEYAEHGIRVNTVSPSAINTPIYQTIPLTKQQYEEFLKKQATQVPLSRCAKISDVLNAILFYASSSASFLLDTSCQLMEG